MPVLNKLLVETKQSAAADTPEIFYTSPSTGLGTVVTNFTATNETSLTRTYKAYIVASGGSPILAVVPVRSLLTNRTDVPAELAGQTIPPGGTLQMESSAAATISFTVSGREES